MGYCLATSIVSCCWSSEDFHRGHIIFQEIKDTLEYTGKNEVDPIIKESKLYMEKAEETRKKMAKKFEDMFIKTGSIVLRQPNVERAILALIVHFLILVTKSAKEKKQIITPDDLKLSEFFMFTKETPFLRLNDAKIEEIKQKYGFSFDRKWIESRDSVINFFESINTLKTAFDGYKNQFINNFKLIKNNITQSEGNAIKRVNTAMTQAKNSISCIEAIKLVANVLEEVISSSTMLSNVILVPQKINTIFKIAEDANNRLIYDPLIIVFTYSKGLKCRKIDDWEENVCYIETSDDMYF